MTSEQLREREVARIRSLANEASKHDRPLTDEELARMRVLLRPSKAA